MMGPQIDNEDKTVKIGADDGGDVDEAKKKILLNHNVEANPAEFGLVSDLVHTIGHWFYEDAYVVVLHAFLKQKVHRESDITKQLFLAPKQVGGILVKLKSHQLILKTTCERGSKLINVWHLDLNRFVDIVQFRLRKMVDILNEEIDELSKTIFHCDHCNKRYSSLDYSTLQYSGSAYYCNNGYCRAQLSPVDTTQKNAKKDMLIRVEKEMKPLHDILNEIAGKTKDDVVKFKQPLNRQIRPSTGNRASFNRKTTSKQSDAQNKAKEEGLEQKKEKNNKQVKEPLSKFDCRPLLFSNEDDVYVPVKEKWDDVKIDAALRLARQTMNDVGEFIKIINSRVYLYKLNPHSLYLAWTRGYAPEEVVRLLKLLGKNPLPMRTERMIREHTNGKIYYKATMTLRKGNYCIASDSIEIIQKLLEHQKVRTLLVDYNKVEQVTTNLGKVSYHVNVSSGQCENVKRACQEVGMPIIDEFDFANSTLENIPIDIKHDVPIRSYQKFAVNRLFWNGFKCHSGILVLPCGAGKTLIGISVVAALKKPTIIFCQSIMAVTQWRDQLLKWTTAEPDMVSRFSSVHTSEWKSKAHVLISTYPMFSAKQDNRSAAARDMMKLIEQREWGLMVLDEVHLVPAKIIRKVTGQIRCHTRVGLTATLVREDGHIEDLPNLVGPKFFELDIFTLRMHNYIAPVGCVELHCPMTDIFMTAYNNSTSLQEKRLIYSTNPNKIRVVHTLISRHMDKKHRIMVFCDNLFCLGFYAEMIKRPKIEGSTNTEERERILHNFRKAENGDCVLFSQVGDQSIDLPEADVVIQVALMHGGRMQEGQRIGRVQRPQPGKIAAYFYSLISDATIEVEYANQRRFFLQDHGYDVKRERKDAWKNYLTEGSDIIRIIDRSVQEKIVEAVRGELNSRDNKRIYGNEPRQASESESKKRKKSTKQEIQRRLKPFNNK